MNKQLRRVKCQAWREEKRDGIEHVCCVQGRRGVLTSLLECLGQVPEILETVLNVENKDGRQRVTSVVAGG